MNSTVKNIIIFVVIGAALVLVYVFFLKPAPPQASLTTSTSSPVSTGATAPLQSSAIGADFLSVLLNVKSIKLNDGIFVNPAFATLHDSSINLTPDGTEGRPNPFAPIGSDVAPKSSPSPIQIPAPKQ